MKAGSVVFTCGVSLLMLAAVYVGVDDIRRTSHTTATTPDNIQDLNFSLHNTHAKLLTQPDIQLCEAMQYPDTVQCNVAARKAVKTYSGVDTQLTKLERP